MICTFRGIAGPIFISGLVIACSSSVKTPANSGMTGTARSTASAARGPSLESSPQASETLFKVCGRVGVPQAEVVADSKSAHELRVFTCETDSEGNFCLLLPLGTYYISAVHPEHIGRGVSTTVVAHDHEVLDLRLEEGGDILRGQVTGASASDERAIYARLVEPKLGEVEPVYVRIGPHGEFHARLKPATYNISLTGPEYVSLVKVASPGETVEIEALPRSALMPEASVKQELIAAAVPLESSDDIQITHFFDNKILVGLGEGTHGTREFSLLRNELTKYMVTSHDYRLVVIEAQWASGKAADEYVTGRTHNLEATVASFKMQLWRSQEMREFLQSIRKINESREDSEMVRVAGIDMQYTDAALGILISYLKENSSPADVRAFESDIAGLADWRLMAPLEEGKLRKYEAAIDRTLTWLKRHRRDSAKGTALEDARQAAFVLLQALRVQGGYSERALQSVVARRDDAMATNLIRLYDKYPQVKAVLWGHNMHIARTPDGIAQQQGLGAILASHFGNEYGAVGFLFGTGEYKAWRADDLDAGPQAVPVESPPAGSFEEMALKVPHEAWFLNLQKAHGSLKDWIGRYSFIRQGGWLFTSQRNLLDLVKLRDWFDAIIFVRTSTSATW